MKMRKKSAFKGQFSTNLNFNYWQWKWIKIESELEEDKGRLEFKS